VIVFHDGGDVEESAFLPFFIITPVSMYVFQ